MQKFTAKIVDMMKQEKLYASQGGPIILSRSWFGILHFERGEFEVSGEFYLALFYVIPSSNLMYGLGF
ncbi:hypothetical protein Scep_019929 [Stephania cephalantha]|uniref:Uncharacterized protein n=1 Tax=Stephania cephalantha TaxID=152367 RepID=A0AAP0IC44_9MAGN